MDILDVKKIIEQELPNILRQDDRFRYLVQDMLQDSFANKQQTDDWFEKMLQRIDQNQAELQTMREESERKWQEQRAESERRWQENQAELRAMREESERKWNENQAELRAMREESERKWQEQRAESERKWQEQRAENHKIWQEIQKINRNIESSIGALGARWGTHSEQAFRNALKSILEESFDVQVLNITDYDDEGEVFGHPDQVELDIIIKNGLLIICEIKSSMSKSDMYTFGRKIRFYEKRHHQTANRRLVISPMIDKRAYPVAQRLNIELFSHATEVDPMP